MLSASGALPLAVVRELVHAAVDVVVHVVRGSDGRRQVAEVAELVPPGELRPRGPRVCDVLAEGRRRPPRRPQP